MGCVSSKIFRRDLKQEIRLGNGDCANHVVSLTSSTYGVLKLDDERPVKGSVVGTKRSPPRDAPEIINAWELMEDLEDGMPISIQAKKSPKSRAFLRDMPEIHARSPLKFLNRMSSPKKLKRFSGKENQQRLNGNGWGLTLLDHSPKRVLKAFNFSENSRNGRISAKGNPVCAQSGSLRTDLGFFSRRPLQAPLFDPELVASFEKEISEEEEHIKKMVSATPKIQKQRTSSNCEIILELFEEKCPPGGKNAVVIYTTTLRGIRKTFEDCNNARRIIESHNVHMFERDVSMDSGFREELRGLMGTKEVKVPLVFVKGRLIGGADELLKLEEEGSLGVLFHGIPRAVAGCEGCAGVRFVMCMDCNGSCKVLDEDRKQTVKCGECNENGLIQCPICC
ncbi:uncharacterized protein At3g28850 [Malania oleifera]|uniref:uncharacterized protein At3g28850 n=1 Tax=Malania oleifera TaxID=397392 RepID=UPI0025AE9616|nr:uncharacterized protein At3g28850 [Malania oleifera]